MDYEPYNNTAAMTIITSSNPFAKFYKEAYNVHRLTDLVISMMFFTQPIIRMTYK